MKPVLWETPMRQSAAVSIGGDVHWMGNGYTVPMDEQPSAGATHPVFRRSNDRVIGGVLGGIAEYLGWTPSRTRILYVVFALFSLVIPFGIIYMVLWTMMPKPERPRRQP